MTKRKTRFRIGLDARGIFMPRPRGTGRNLLDAYQLIPPMCPEWEFVLYHQRESADVMLGNHPNVRTRRIDIPGDRFDLWFQTRLPLAAWRDGVDLLHLPANAAPAWSPVPFVVTVHDLMPLTIADGQSPHGRDAFRRGVERAVRGAVHLISPSNATRDELCQRFGVSHERITVIPWAPDRGVARVLGDAAPAGLGSLGSSARAEVERVRARYGLDGAWLLNFSGSSPRKNAAGLVDAIACLSPETRGDLRLVLVGCEPASFRVELEARARRLGVQQYCRLLGFVPHEDLPGLLCGARGLVMPSLCEGFGLPILDAFACGIPVLTSRLSSMPEVAGDAAVYCDPRSPESIAEGITRLLYQPIAEQLRLAGCVQLRQFSWERTARLMCEVYERCLSESVRRGAGKSVIPSSQPETCGAEV